MLKMNMFSIYFHAIMFDYIQPKAALDYREPYYV